VREIETLEQLDRLAAHPAATADWLVQGLDLTDRGELLGRLDVAGALFLGCRLDPGVENDLRARGALVFPTVPDVPVDVYRSRLYGPAELYGGLARSDNPGRSYEETLDALAYAWARDATDMRALLAQSLHDLSVADALEEFVSGRRLVGVMGGHALDRDVAGYAEAARLGHLLAGSGLTVGTGGGPGAMEAVNLGAYLSGHDASTVKEAVEQLAAVPTYEPSVADWAAAAFAVRDRWPGGVDSLGVPTWFYGHEPPNAFANQIAKYFKNALREDVLLHVCRAGIVFLPGRGGTVQEVFQDACENYYATAADIAPMVLVGREYWTDELPVWPLLTALAAGRDMAGSVHLVDGIDDVLPVLAAR
jgi:predicted Rossmann-fold nucleotide-binding protein